MKQEKKTYYEVGEEFQAGLVRLKCVESENGRNVCNGCFFRDNEDCTYITTNIIGECVSSGRDGKDVIFVPVKENDSTEESTSEKPEHKYDSIDLDGFIKHLSYLVILYGIDKHVGVSSVVFTNYIVDSLNGLITFLNAKKIGENIPEKQSEPKSGESDQTITNTQCTDNEQKSKDKVLAFMKEIKKKAREYFQDSTIEIEHITTQKNKYV